MGQIKALTWGAEAKPLRYFSHSIISSNTAYIYLPLPYLQLLKAITAPTVYFIGALFRNEKLPFMRTMILAGTFCIVTLWLFLEENTHQSPASLQIGSAVAFQAPRLVLIQKYVSQFSPLTLLYHAAPCWLLFLSVPWMIYELPLLVTNSSLNLEFETFVVNCVVAFGMNMAVFWVVGSTSAFTMNVSGVGKDFLLMAFYCRVIKGRDYNCSSV